MKGPGLEAGDLLEFKGGGGCATLFGLVFAGFGGVFVYLALAHPEGDQTGRLVGGIMGGLFVLIGLGLALGRSGIRIDKREGQGSRWYGLGIHALGVRIPIKQTVFPLAQFREVVLDRETRSSSSSSGGSRKSIVYPVRLTGPGEPLKLKETGDYQESRRIAESLARHLALNLVDSSSGEEVVREPEFLDETLAEKARRTGERVKVPIMPPGMRSKIGRKGLDLVITVPPTGLTWIHFLGLGFLALFGALSFFLGGRMFPVFLALATLPILINAFSGSGLLVDDQGLAVRKTTFGIGRWKRIPKSELEELILKNSRLGEVDVDQIPEKARKWVEIIMSVAVRPQIIARSDRMLLALPLAVGKEELDYLFALVKSKLIR